MATEEEPDLIKEGERDYQEWRASLVDTPQKRALYEEVSARSDLWLQLVEARRAVGLTQRELAKRLGVSQAQVARIEKRGYENYTLNSLLRYVKALGEDFTLEVRVQRRSHEDPLRRRPTPDKTSRPRSGTHARQTAAVSETAAVFFETKFRSFQIVSHSGKAVSWRSIWAMTPIPPARSTARSPAPTTANEGYRRSGRPVWPRRT